LQVANPTEDIETETEICGHPWQQMDGRFTTSFARNL
jgi:hypothetical protein